MTRVGLRFAGPIHASSQYRCWCWLQSVQVSSFMRSHRIIMSWIIEPQHHGNLGATIGAILLNVWSGWCMFWGCYEWLALAVGSTLGGFAIRCSVGCLAWAWAVLACDLSKSSALCCRCLLFMLNQFELLAIIEDLIIAWNEWLGLVTCRLQSYHAWSLLVLLELRSQITGISSIVYMTVSKTTSVKSEKCINASSLQVFAHLLFFGFKHPWRVMLTM